MQLSLQKKAVIMRLRSGKQEERRDVQVKDSENCRKCEEEGDVEAITSEAVFRRKLKSYIKHCNSDEKHRRLPNAAGFCRFCSISRKSFASLAEKYPLMFDIAQSTFIDEALNNKFPNSAANMNYLAELTNSICGCDSNTVKIICEHDPLCDGE